MISSSDFCYCHLSCVLPQDRVIGSFTLTSGKKRDEIIWYNFRYLPNRPISKNLMWRFAVRIKVVTYRYAYGSYSQEKIKIKLYFAPFNHLSSIVIDFMRISTRARSKQSNQISFEWHLSQLNSQSWCNILSEMCHMQNYLRI